jgi:hypothetical protein
MEQLSVNAFQISMEILLLQAAGQSVPSVLTVPETRPVLIINVEIHALEYAATWLFVMYSIIVPFVLVHRIILEIHLLSASQHQVNSFSKYYIIHHLC